MRRPPYSVSSRHQPPSSRSDAPTSFLRFQPTLTSFSIPGAVSCKLPAEACTSLCPRQSLLLAGSAFQGHEKLHIVKAKVYEVIVESFKPSPDVTTKIESQPLKGNEESIVEAAVVDSEISAFLDEVSSLIKLVDLTDITEL